MIRATATVRIDGAKVSALLARVGQGLFDGVTQVSEKIRDDAKAICPVDTGALRDSIDAQVTRGVQNMLVNRSSALQTSAFAVTGIISPHTDYAAYVEYGTGQRGAASPGAGEGPYNPEWPGMVAKPYMRPAWDGNKGTVSETIGEAVKQALK